MPRRDDDFEDDRDRDPDRVDGYHDRDEQPRPRKRGLSTGGILLIVGGIVLLCGGCLVGGGIYGVFGVRDAANRMKSRNNLMQIGLAVHNYHDVNGELPANTSSRDGKPLLSWRVHLLPYVEQDALYRQFKLDEPWDSPNNRPLAHSIPSVYLLPNRPANTAPGLTHYRGFSSPGAVFDRRRLPGRNPVPKDALTLAGFKDGTPNTILVVEAADPVEWTRPDDLDAGLGAPFPHMGNFHRGNKFQAVFGDGTVRLLRSDLPEATLRALVTHSGGEQLPPNWDQ